MIFKSDDLPMSARDDIDRIFVRDYIRDADVGVYASEHGVTQRVRFNVMLEVTPGRAHESDDVCHVLSYETIVDAIDALTRGAHINLLETLAEHVAEKCLTDPRARRAVVRIEKLERIPGTLGVEIVRHRRDPADG